MPELPDIVVYVDALTERIVHTALSDVKVVSPFVVRTFDPPIQSLKGAGVTEVRRLGKRVAIGFEHGRWLVIHLMVMGRLHWKDAPPKPTDRQALAAFVFPAGVLVLTESGTKKRASIHVVAGEEQLAGHDPGGIDVLDAELGAFRANLTKENHTVKRALTDPRLFSGIGNAYSDEILHAARLSPVMLTHRMTDEQVAALYRAARQTLQSWIERLRAEAAGKFPKNVTAFHEGMRVHGRFGCPCPDCGTAVQRIRYAENETNYCPRCQTGGAMLADRALSRLLKSDWPSTIDELEAGPAGRLRVPEANLRKKGTGR
jgi:formamidopyrimidine-DNA glycosylase